MNSTSSVTKLNNIELVVSPTLKCRIVTHQPFTYSTGDQVTIVCGGSPKLNGKDCFAEELLTRFQQRVADLYNNLDGKFWLLIIDHAKQTALLVNDVMGIQSCFYTVQHNTFYISDSLKLIKQQDAVQCTLSKQAIFNYFYCHCIPAPNTIYEECFKLSPGNALSIDSNGVIDTENFYSPEFATSLENNQAAEKQCLENLQHIVEQQTKPDSGAFLSGGLDSSTVSGLLSKIQDNAKTFSIGFKVAEYDETAYANITAEHFQTDHKTLYLTPEMASAEFIDVAQYFDEPFGNSSAMAAYFCAKFAKQHGVNHLLAGDGGDELFAGNERYAKQKIFEHFHQAPDWQKILPRTAFVNSVAEKIPVVKKVASYIKQADVSLPDRLENYNFIQQLGAENMFPAAFLAQVDQEQPLQQKRERFSQCTSHHPVDQMLYLDWKFTLADNDLVKVTKMCELADVDVDFPFLSKSLIDFSCRIPADIKLPGNKLRDFYKKACKGFLADATLSKSKHGFGLPFGVWMKEDKTLKELTLTTLNQFKTRNIVKASFIDEALKAHQNIHSGYYGELIWIMVILELWLQGNE
ncbi:asparagine synthetase B family protein [Neptunicella marina]|uniref:asparagine synthase (glutamine-hydrolyzing) n=1 Tax=Neptunicella marina TaxID=2125989 RepID=A0A8J6ISV2_9ALTE|nr:asparagine synthase-related protein [Neptunicella marina]MBC3765769.1 asparagine synthase [Neptunicella marina]